MASNAVGKCPCEVKGGEQSTERFSKQRPGASDTRRVHCFSPHGVGRLPIGSPNRFSLCVNRKSLSAHVWHLVSRVRRPKGQAPLLRSCLRSSDTADAADTAGTHLKRFIPRLSANARQGLVGGMSVPTLASHSPLTACLVPTFVLPGSRGMTRLRQVTMLKADGHLCISMRHLYNSRLCLRPWHTIVSASPQATLTVASVFSLTNYAPVGGWPLHAPGLKLADLPVPMTIHLGGQCQERDLFGSVSISVGETKQTDRRLMGSSTPRRVGQ